MYSRLSWMYKWRVRTCTFVWLLMDTWFHSHMLNTAAKSSRSHLFHHHHPDLLPTPSLFALLKSSQAQRCSFGARRLPRDAEASSSALKKVNQRVSAGLLWPERRAFALTWWEMSAPTGGAPAHRQFFTVLRGYRADSWQLNEYLSLCFTADIWTDVTTEGRSGYYMPRGPF